MNDKSVFAGLITDNSEKEQPSEPVTVPRGPMLRPVVPPSDYMSPQSRNCLTG